jgi:hypothetical protein
MHVKILRQRAADKHHWLTPVEQPVFVAMVQLLHIRHKGRQRLKHVKVLRQRAADKHLRLAPVEQPVFVAKVQLLHIRHKSRQRLINP